MKTLSNSAIRNNLAKAIDQVTEDHTPNLIARQKGTPTVLISEDFESWQETTYLMRTPANAAHLRCDVAQVKAGKRRGRKLLK